MSASSQFGSDWRAKYGRLRNNAAWCSISNGGSSQYLQVDFGVPFYVTGIAIQGQANHFVKSYKLFYKAHPGDTWNTYMENSTEV